MILSIIIIGILIFFIKTIKEANKKKNEFIEYLEDKNDYQNFTTVQDKIIPIAPVENH